MNALAGTSTLGIEHQAPGSICFAVGAGNVLMENHPLFQPLPL